MSKKRILYLLLIIFLVFSSANFVSAEELTVEQKIISIVEASQTIEEQSDLLSKLLNEENLIEPHSEYISNQSYVTKINKLRNGRTITFLSDGCFLVESLFVETNNNNTNITPMGVSLYTPEYTKSTAGYGPVGNLLWEAWVKGYFKYNFETMPTPYLTDAGYRRGFLSLWQVTNWQQGTSYLYYNDTAYCYAKGNFHWGAEYEGNGVIFQERYVELNLYCSISGNVY